MKLNETDYVLKRTRSGRYFVCFIYCLRFRAMGDTVEEAVNRLQEKVDDIVNGMYMVEEFV